MFHLRLEVGRWWFQVGRSEPQEPDDPPPPFIDHHPTPERVYTPDFVGFVRMPEPTE